MISTWKQISDVGKRCKNNYTKSEEIRNTTSMKEGSFSHFFKMIYNSNVNCLLLILMIPTSDALLIQIR